MKQSIAKKYIENRERVISEFINAVRTYYPKDKKILSHAVSLTTTLEVAAPNVEFVNDLRGFFLWADSTSQPLKEVVTTIFHDLNEFKDNRKEKWFSPRTSGYSKYLSGASNLVLV